jgi:hypothetical protein
VRFVIYVVIYVYCMYYVFMYIMYIVIYAYHEFVIVDSEQFNARAN